MKVNRHFLPKSNIKLKLDEHCSKMAYQKNLEIMAGQDLQLQGGKSPQQQSESKNGKISDWSHRRNRLLEQRKQELSNKEEVACQDQESPRVSGQVTERKIKLEHLRQSVESLEKMIQNSKSIMNESSFFNDNLFMNKTSISPKHKIKSQSLQIKFNYSTRKMNETMMKEQLLNSTMEQFDEVRHQLSKEKQKNGERLTSINCNIKNGHLRGDKHERKQLRILSPQNINQWDKKITARDEELGRGYQKMSSSAYTRQIKNSTQLNSTLEKLLNQSFQSSINPTRSQIPTPSTKLSLQKQSPRWFQGNSKFSMLNKIRQQNERNRMESFRNPLFEKWTGKQQDSDHNDEENQNHQQNMLITEENQLDFSQQQQDLNRTFRQDQIETQGSAPLTNIQNFTTKSRQVYQNQLKLPDTFCYDKPVPSTNLNNPLQPSKKMNLQPPKAYKSYFNAPNSKKMPSSTKSWIPKNFESFQKQVLRSNDYNKSNVFRQTSNSKGKFSPRIIPTGKKGKENKSTSIKSQYNQSKTYDLSSNNDSMKKKQFIKQVWAYPFAQRYLKQTDILAIYDRLKHSKIPQHNWVLFVIDLAYKKMKQSND